MSDERGSSGSSTALMVVAILAGILLVGCCGGVVSLGLLGMVGWRREVRPPQVQMQPPQLVPMAPGNSPEVNKAIDELNKDLEPLKITPEDAAPSALGDQGSAKPEVVPAPEKEQESQR